ncbi:PREDICTED: cip1-interacting zinc finger protein-like isoform X3 [Cyprinodon variegatus]|uniref:cip1-interacting zinc finger protein-like isoform X3 n=1 Tax=Cyprinodon variegatus TaxID=28743 RepID=UPI0007427DB1|nr:PREDICTED: cip1-interacting zinc finger protein-like isoform X3 [Cyprinodon variegatus]
MVRQSRRRDRCFLPAAEGGVAKVRFPRSPDQKVLPPAQQASASGSCDMRPCSTATAGEKRAKDGRSRAGGQGSAGGSGETQMKRSRQNGNQVAAVVLCGPKAPGSCDPAGDVSGSEQQGAAEESRAAQLQSVGSLKVTIQQSSDSRAFGHAHPHPAPLHCHVCKLTCGSQQDFQDHMTGSEHLRKLQDVTQSIRLNAHPLLDRGRRPQTQRWCDTCQSHFTGDIIVHRRTAQHKVCKQRGRPFCPVCHRHFRTPRKFVEHMKSAEHKEQVQLEEEQEEELITVDAVGCFQEEEEVEVVDDDDDDEDEERSETVDSKEQEEEFDPQRTYGSSFVVPVHGFVCLLCKKFFYRETAARHTHCRTHTHYQNLQVLKQPHHPLLTPSGSWSPAGSNLPPSTSDRATDIIGTFTAADVFGSFCRSDYPPFH